MEGSTKRSSRDIAREIVELAKAGRAFTIDGATYTPARDDSSKWSIEFPSVDDIQPDIVVG